MGNQTGDHPVTMWSDGGDRPVTVDVGNAPTRAVVGASVSSSTSSPHRAPVLTPALLPHRPPFRFVDEVVEYEPGRSITARWRIVGDEPWLAGHFPGDPIVPGVLQVEALAQVGAIAVLAVPEVAGRLPVLGGVESARFRRQVVPGDELVLTVDLEHLGSRGGWGKGRATVDGIESCSARILFVVVDRPADPGGTSA